jgi:hypothetical protein
MPLRIVSVVLALLLAYVVVRTHVGFVLAQVMPEVALSIDPRNSSAMNARADEWFAQKVTADEGERRAAFTIRTLERSPYEIGAIRNLAENARAKGQIPRMIALYALAGRISIRDVPTHRWLYELYLGRSDFAKAINEADIILRSNQDSWTDMMPRLMESLGQEGFRSALLNRLLTRPAWRDMFLYRLASSDRHAAHGFGLFKDLKARNSPANIGELAPYFRWAMNTQPPTIVYQQWASLLPNSLAAEGRSLLRDGDFKGMTAPPPFVWQFSQGDMMSVRPENETMTLGTALLASFSSGLDSDLAKQALVLAPGEYSLTWRSYTEGVTGSGAFGWAIDCITPTARATLSTVDIDLQQGQPISGKARFTVPGNCNLQQVKLVGKGGQSSNETPEIWLDEVKILAN